MSSDYAARVGRAYKQSVVLILIAFVVLCGAVWENKVELLVSGVAVAVLAVLAQYRLSHLGALLTPNTFSTPEINAVLLKYRERKATCGLLAVLLTIAGIILGGLASL